MMKRKLFSFLLATSLLLTPLAAFGEEVMEPADGDAAWVLQEGFGDSFTDSVIYAKTDRNSAQKVTVNGESCLRLWNNDGYDFVTSYPVELKELDTPITEDYVVFKGKFLIPKTTDSNNPLEGEVKETGLPEFSIHNSVAGSWQDDTTFAVQFDAKNSKINCNHKDAGGTQRYGSAMAPISYDAWHEVAIILDIVYGTADTYLDGFLVIDDYAFDANKSAKIFGVEAGFHSTLNAVSYVDDIRIFTTVEPEIEEGEEVKRYKPVTSSDVEILGYYAYDDFEAYKENIAGLVMQDWSDPSDTSKYGMDEHLHLENGNKYVQGSSTWTQGRAFSLYSPLKSGYAHLHTDIKLAEGGVAFVGLGKDQVISGNSNPRANLVNAAYFKENKIQLLKTITNDMFDEAITSTHIELPIDFSVGEWHSVDFLFDMTNKQFDIFVDGMPRVVDLYFTLEENGYLPVEDFVYRSAVVGVGEASTGNIYYDNVYVADVTGKYVADMFEEGYEKYLTEHTFSVGGSCYLTEDFLLPFNGYAYGPDVHVDYSTTNEGISIYERTNYSPYDDMRVFAIDGAIGNEGEFTVEIEKGGEERTVTVPLNLIPRLEQSTENSSLYLSKFSVGGDLRANGEIFAGGFVENTSTEDITADLVIAVYEGKTLRIIEFGEITIPAQKTDAVSSTPITLPADLPEGCTAKAFLWTLAGMRPLI